MKQILQRNIGSLFLTSHKKKPFASSFRITDCYFHKNLQRNIGSLRSREYHAHFLLNKERVCLWVSMLYSLTGCIG